MPPITQQYKMHECCKAVNGPKASNDKCHIPLVRDPLSLHTLLQPQPHDTPPHITTTLPGAHLKQVTDTLVRGTRIITTLPGAHPLVREPFYIT